MNRKIFTYVIMGLWIAMAIFCFIVGLKFMQEQKVGGGTTIKYYTIICWGLSAVSVLMALMRFVQQRNETKKRKHSIFNSKSVEIGEYPKEENKNE